MVRKYTDELLQSIKEKQYILNTKKLEILVKPSPDLDREGYMDVRAYGTMKNKIPILKLLPDDFSKKINPNLYIFVARKIFDNVYSLPVAKKIKVVKTKIDKLDVRFYSRKDNKDLRPILLYIHGGGFIGGNMDVTEEFCKLIAEKGDYIVVAVNYRLAPENKFPAWIDDCFKVLEWLDKHASEINGLRDNIFIAGDSAGGNIATVCCLKAKEKNKDIIKGQILIYPTVNLAGGEDEEFKFSMDEYIIADEHKDAIEGLIKMLDDLLSNETTVMKKYLGISDPNHPYISPYIADLNDMPPCLMIYGEHDYLKVECEAYMRKLQKAKVPIKTICYLGLSHGFINHVGIFPQTEDCVDEIVNFINNS